MFKVNATNQQQCIKHLWPHISVLAVLKYFSKVTIETFEQHPDFEQVFAHWAYGKAILANVPFLYLLKT